MKQVASVLVAVITATISPLGDYQTPPAAVMRPSLLEFDEQAWEPVVVE